MNTLESLLWVMVGVISAIIFYVRLTAPARKFKKWEKEMKLAAQQYADEIYFTGVRLVNKLYKEGFFEVETSKSDPYILMAIYFLIVGPILEYNDLGQSLWPKYEKYFTANQKGYNQKIFSLISSMGHAPIMHIDLTHDEIWHSMRNSIVKNIKELVKVLGVEDWPFPVAYFTTIPRKTFVQLS